MTRTSETLRVGDSLEVVIEKAVYRGLGLARHQGQVVLVRRGLPRDRVRVRVEETGRGYVRAGVEMLLDPSPRRHPSPCPLFARCGGCAYQDVEYRHQLELKEAILREALARAGAAWQGDIVVHGSPEPGWRTRATLHLGLTPEGSVGLGLNEEGSHRLVDLVACEQLTPLLHRTQRALLEGLRDHPYRARVRDLRLAQGKDGEGMVAVIEGDLDARAAASLASVGRAVPWLTGFGALNDRGTFVLLAGSPYVHSTVVGRRLRSHALAFFQGNRFLVDDLVGTVSGLIPAGATLLDLYAGVGLFSLAVAPQAATVMALEGDPYAVADAQVNVRAAGFDQVRVRSGDVLDSLRGLRRETGEAIVLDPSRGGAGPRVVEAIVRRQPACIVYVSCDPPTLGRDLALLQRAGFRPDAVHVFDLFPATFHLEAVIRLSFMAL